MRVETSPERAPRGVGRPRRLTVDSILDAACEIGLAKFEMSMIAKRLNTGVATLYGYVESRDHILQLACERLAGRSLIVDRDQTWQNLLREHAAVTSALFESSPSLISNLIGGGRDVRPFAYSQQVLAMLQARGFTEAEAIDVFVEVSQVLIGSAVCVERRKLLGGNTLDASGNPFALPASFGDYRPTLERIIQTEEARRS